MKTIIATIVSTFAFSAFAAEPAKATVTPAPAATASAPAPTVAKKEEVKPAKSEPAKKDAKASAPAAK